MTAPTTHATFRRLTAEEMILALPATHSVHVPAPRPTAGPRAVLERILTGALRTPPCYVLFSGGRDSSALLALAVAVARREGLPLPVPVTSRYPESPETDETAWQELVLGHLGLREHIVVEIRHEVKLLGQVATDAIRRHGIAWPEAVQLHGARYRHLDPGVVITGEGGDGVIEGHRMGVLRTAAALTRPRRHWARAGLRAAEPVPLTRARARRHAVDLAPPWLRPPAAERWATLVGELAVVPLRWDTATRRAIRRRYMEVFLSNVDASITEYGCRPVIPFVDPEFVEALARAGGPLGWGGRTEIFRRLFSDVLPEAVIARSSKASFNSTRWGPDEREFARTWDGTGFDDAFVDPELLRAEWLTENPHSTADFLLHVAWAHSQGLPVETAP